MSERGYAFRNGWRWVGWYLRRGRVVPAIRQIWLAYVAGYGSEVCQDCGRSYPLWRADDDLYSLVTGWVGRHGEDNPAAKLTWGTVESIRARYASGGISQDALAHEYGVSQPVISDIVLGRKWRGIGL